MRALVVLVLVAFATPAFAHQSSIKYTDITVDGARATVRVTIAPPDVTEPLGLPPDATPPVSAALAPVAATYVSAWLDVALPAGAACLRGPATSAPDPDGKFVVVTWDATCPEPIERLALDFTRFFALDARHEAILRVHRPEQDVAPIVVRADRPRLTVQPGHTSILGWIRLGMDHIYGGLDHLVFVLALLLVVVLARGTSGWELRRPLAALRATAWIVTAFTVAHSVSLIAASLGWVQLPGRLVESVIAASIAYTAIENVIRPDARWRFVLTFSFGLVHGLGFASVLEELLPPSAVVVPLVAFNVGVEVGQLTIVVVALPVFWAVARGLGPERYRRYGLAVAGLPLAILGILWLIERV